MIRNWISCLYRLIDLSTPGLLKEPVEGEEVVETRVLKGCVRIGDLANGLLLRGDKSLEMLVFCTDKPTVYMLQNIKEKFEELLTVRFGWFLDKIPYRKILSRNAAHSASHFICVGLWHTNYIIIIIIILLCYWPQMSAALWWHINSLSKSPLQTIPNPNRLTRKFSRLPANQSDFATLAIIMLGGFWPGECERTPSVISYRNSGEHLKCCDWEKLPLWKTSFSTSNKRDVNCVIITLFFARAR